MRIDVAVNGGEAELRSLLDWLRRDPAARRGAHVELVQAEPAPGQMGMLTDVLQLVTENAWSAASFALALSTWRQTRPHARRITVRRGDLTVDLDGGDDEELRRLIDVLERPAAVPDSDRDRDRQADGEGR
ncbi:effector-associated constant component EACC1 [Streptomyces antimycoticus]|uniref:effector-associated constant component EACC1 n=1 Tax=Streptomyces antimycoticus TaxID=68175 RepID=UPI003692525A